MCVCVITKAITFKIEERLFFFKFKIFHLRSLINTPLMWPMTTLDLIFVGDMLLLLNRIEIVISFTL